MSLFERLCRSLNKQHENNMKDLGSTTTTTTREVLGQAVAAALSRTSWQGPMTRLEGTKGNRMLLTFDLAVLEVVGEETLLGDQVLTRYLQTRVLAALALDLRASLL